MPPAAKLAVSVAVGGSSQYLQEVVGVFDSAVAGPVGVVVGEDLVGPGDDGVDDVVELGQFAGLVEVCRTARGRQGGGGGRWRGGGRGVAGGPGGRF